MEKIKTNHCWKCNHRWEQRVKIPKVCPSCKNPNWDKKNNKEIVKLIVGDFWDNFS